MTYTFYIRLGDQFLEWRGLTQAQAMQMNVRTAKNFELTNVPMGTRFTFGWEESK